MGALAVPLLIGGVGLMGVGTIMSARAQAAAGRAAGAEAEAAAVQAQEQSALAEYNAQLAEREAQATEQKTAYAQQKQAEAAARGISTLEAGLGISGAVTTAGAPLLLKAKQASEFELENLMIGYEGRTEAARARSEAVMQNYLAKAGLGQASVYRQRAGYNVAAGRMAAGTTLMTGFGSMGLMAGSALYKPTPAGKFTPEGRATLLRY